MVAILYSYVRLLMNSQLMEHFTNATDSDLHGGMRWYKDAHHRAKRISKELNIELYKVVGVISALSPRNKWDRNMKDAVAVIRKRKKAVVATFGANKAKAIKILDANSESEVRTLLNGRKITSFYDNILRPLHSKSITIDVWAFRSLGLEPSNKNYLVAEKEYAETAKHLKLRAHELQAIIWSVVRGGAT